VEIFNLTCNSCIRPIQNFDENQVSRSGIIVSGSPSKHQISFRKIRASSLMWSSVLREMKCAIFENLFTMSHIFVYSSDLGTPTMKSMDIEVHGCNMCTCSGNGTQGRAVLDLLCLVDLYLVYLI